MAKMWNYNHIKLYKFTPYYKKMTYCVKLPLDWVK